MPKSLQPGMNARKVRSVFLGKLILGYSADGSPMPLNGKAGSVYSLISVIYLWDKYSAVTISVVCDRSTVMRMGISNYQIAIRRKTRK